MMEADVAKTQAKNDRPKSEDVSVRAQRMVTQRDHSMSCLLVHSWKHGGTERTGRVGVRSACLEVGRNPGKMVIQSLG
jgi:hypothetical protein